MSASKQSPQKRPRLKALSIFLLVAGAAILSAIALEVKNRRGFETAQPSQVSRPSPEELQALAGNLGGPPPLTPEQIAEEQRLDAEQVESARRWLTGNNPATRVEGAEQLAAYPTPEAERLLAHALANDPSPEVRAAAAQSLEEFEQPTEETIGALLAALEDESEEVRRDVWSALEGLLANEEDGSARAGTIITGLKTKTASPRLADEIRDEIREFLADQAPESR